MLLDSVAFRPCDAAACKLLDHRASSVFTPPARYMLRAAGDYAPIRALVEGERQHNPAAKSLSAQAAGIVGKVAESSMNGCAPTPIASSGCSSATPRLSFGALNGGAPLAADKRSTAGVMRGA